MKNSWLIIFLTLSVYACTQNSKQSELSSKPVVDEAEKVKVQHILIAFGSSLPDRKIDRDQAAAKELAVQVLKEARKTDDFGALVKAHSDDQVPGIFEITNHDAERTSGQFARSEMPKALGDLAFKLEVGEVGMAAYDGDTAPYGFHILKRLE